MGDPKMVAVAVKEQERNRLPRLGVGGESPNGRKRTRTYTECYLYVRLRGANPELNALTALTVIRRYEAERSQRARTARVFRISD